MENNEVIPARKTIGRRGWSLVGATIVIGAALVVASLHLKTATRSWVERQVHTEVVKGNRTGTTVAGTAVGTGAGVGVGATIGGVGVVLCGTGIGIPAGAVCLLAGGICGLIGGAIGHLVGTPDRTIEVVEYVTHTEPLVDSWVWISVLSVGVVLVAGGIALAICYMVWHRRLHMVMAGIENKGSLN